MRWLTGIFLLISLALFSAYIFVKGYPYRLYAQWSGGEGWNRYYQLSDYRPSLLRPVPLEELVDYSEDYAHLWKDFPLRNSMIPLPIRHPHFQVQPIVNHRARKDSPEMGILIEAPNTEEISRVYTAPTTLFPDYSLGQELFKLPFVRNRIVQRSVDEIWRDIFSREIVVESKTLTEMIYDLHILHIRSKFLPRETVRYGLGQSGNQAIIELASRNPDYLVELVMNQDSGSIYSFLLQTHKKSEKSMQLRTKFLKAVSFMPADQAMGRILYTEFKQLNFTRQVGQEGMLYLFSAWSQNPEEVNFLKELIFFLERGKSNVRALSNLYTFAFKRYGKTFTTRRIFTDHHDPEIDLQRKIEIENLEKKLSYDRQEVDLPPEPEMSPDERMNFYLKKAKELEPVQKDDMTIH